MTTSISIVPDVLTLAKWIHERDIELLGRIQAGGFSQLDMNEAEEILKLDQSMWPLWLVTKIRQRS